MSPSFPHEKLSYFLDYVVDVAGDRDSPAPWKRCAAPACADGATLPAPGWSPTARSTSASAPGQGLSCRCRRRGGGSRRLHRTHRARPGDRDRDHERGRKQNRTLRRAGGAGAVAAAQPREVVGVPGGVPRPASRERGAQARRLGGPRWAHAGRRARRGGRGTGWRDPRRSDEGGGTRRAATPGRHGADTRGGSGLLRGSDGSRGGMGDACVAPTNRTPMPASRSRARCCCAPGRRGGQSRRRRCRRTPSASRDRLHRRPHAAAFTAGATPDGKAPWSMWYWNSSRK